MKKTYLTMFSLVAFAVLQAQVGVNTETPKTTLHVIPTKTDATTAEGIIAPNLTRAQLIGKDTRYVSDQRGAIVYITSIDGTVSTKTAKVTAIGYYYFDGAVWQPFGSQSVIVPTEPWKVQGSGARATSNSENIYQAGQVAIGKDLAGVVANEALNVTGTTMLFNAVGIGRVPSTSGNILAVQGNSSLVGNISVSGTSTLTGHVGIGRVPSSSYILATNGGAYLGNGGNIFVEGTGNIEKTLTVKGATTIASTGSLTLAGNGAGANKYLASDAAGKGTWTALPSTATTEPWKIQGSGALATGNTENIYQAGKVAIGKDLSGVVANEALHVTGSTLLSNAVGIGRVPSTSGNILAVQGNSSLAGNISVSGTSTLTGNVGIGKSPATTFKLDVNGDIRTKNIDLQQGNLLGMGLTDQFTYDSQKMGHYALKWTSDSASPGGASYWLSGYGGIRMFTQGKYRLGVTHEGVLQYPGNGAGAGAVLTSDASGNATWKNSGKSSGNWFYLPSINLDMGSTSPKNVDLFDKGVKQLLANAFLAAGLPGSASDYFYIIIGHSGHITVNGLDGNGVLNYTPKTTTPPAEAYLNIVVAVK